MSGIDPRVSAVADAAAESTVATLAMPDAYLVQVQAVLLMQYS